VYRVYLDANFINYIKFLLLNVTAYDMAYFELIKPEIRKLFTDYDYNGNLLQLLTEFYFNAKDERSGTIKI